MRRSLLRLGLNDRSLVYAFERAWFVFVFLSSDQFIDPLLAQFE